MKKSKKQYRWIIVVVVLLVVGGGYWRYAYTRPPRYETVKIVRGVIASTVTVTGRVKSAESVDLAFEKGGKIKNAFVKIGDKVAPGQALAVLDASELAANLLQAEANVETQTAKLEELKRGTRPEEIRVKAAELRRVEQDLANYYGSVADIVNDAYVKADDAVRTKTDPLFVNGDSESPRLSFSVTDMQAEIDVLNARRAATLALRTWRNELASISSSSTNVIFDSMLVSASQHLYVVRDLLSHAIDAVNKASGVSAADVNTYKTNIGLGRTNVSAAVSAVTAQQQAIAAQTVVVERVRNELALSEAGASAESITAQDAQVKQAEANVAGIRAQITKSTLYAPIAGIVTKQDAKAGEIAVPNTTLITLMAERNLEIEAQVPEVDVGRIAVGKSVTIALDAFPGETFRGKVSYIDPAETIIDGVVNFKVTVTFDVGEEKFRSGLTANLEIESMKKEGVLIAPEFAIVEGDKGVFVRVPNTDGTTRDEPVTLGIRSNGFVEIMSGVVENEAVVNVGLKTGVAQ